VQCAALAVSFSVYALQSSSSCGITGRTSSPPTTAVVTYMDETGSTLKSQDRTLTDWVADIGAVTQWDPWDTSLAPTLENLGTKFKRIWSLPPNFVTVIFVGSEL